MIIERLQMQSVQNLHRSLLFKMAPYAAVPVVVPDLILAGHVSMVDGLKQRAQDAQKRGDLIDLSYCRTCSRTVVQSYSLTLL